MRLYFSFTACGHKSEKLWTVVFKIETFKKIVPEVKIPTKGEKDKHWK